MAKRVGLKVKADFSKTAQQYQLNITKVFNTAINFATIKTEQWIEKLILVILDSQEIYKTNLRAFLVSKIGKKDADNIIRKVRNSLKTQVKVNRNLIRIPAGPMTASRKTLLKYSIPPFFLPFEDVANLATAALQQRKSLEKGATEEMQKTAEGAAKGFQKFLAKNPEVTAEKVLLPSGTGKKRTGINVPMIEGVGNAVNDLRSRGRKAIDFINEINRRFPGLIRSQFKETTSNLLLSQEVMELINPFESTVFAASFATQNFPGTAKAQTILQIKHGNVNTSVLAGVRSLVEGLNLLEGEIEILQERMFSDINLGLEEKEIEEGDFGIPLEFEEIQSGFQELDLKIGERLEELKDNRARIIKQISEISKVDIPEAEDATLADIDKIIADLENKSISSATERETFEEDLFEDIWRFTPEFQDLAENVKRGVRKQAESLRLSIDKEVASTFQKENMIFDATGKRVQLTPRVPIGKQPSKEDIKRKDVEIQQKVEKIAKTPTRAGKSTFEQIRARFLEDKKTFINSVLDPSKQIFEKVAKFLQLNLGSVFTFFFLEKLKSARNVSVEGERQPDRSLIESAIKTVFKGVNASLNREITDDIKTEAKLFKEVYIDLFTLALTTYVKNVQILGFKGAPRRVFKTATGVPRERTVLGLPVKKTKEEEDDDRKSDIKTEIIRSFSLSDITLKIRRELRHRAYVETLKIFSADKQVKISKIHESFSENRMPLYLKGERKKKRKRTEAAKGTLGGFIKDRKNLTTILNAGEGRLKTISEDFEGFAGMEEPAVIDRFRKLEERVSSFIGEEGGQFQASAQSVIGLLNQVRD